MRTLTVVGDESQFVRVKSGPAQFQGPWPAAQEGFDRCPGRSQRCHCLVTGLVANRVGCVWGQNCRRRLFATIWRLVVLGHTLRDDDIEVTRVVEKADPQYAVLCDRRFVVLLDTTVDRSLREEGLARELVNRVQRMRKRAGLKPTKSHRSRRLAAVVV